eukprot:761663-Hanusia_phi.AAC.4
MERESIRTKIDDENENEDEDAQGGYKAESRSRSDFRRPERTLFSKDGIVTSMKFEKASGTKSRIRLLQELVSDLANSAITASVGMVKHTKRTWQVGDCVQGGILEDHGTCREDIMYQGQDSQTCSSSEANSESVDSTSHSLSDSESDTCSKQSATRFGADVSDKFDDCESQPEVQVPLKDEVGCRSEGVEGLVLRKTNHVEAMDRQALEQLQLGDGGDEVEVIDELKMQEAVAQAEEPLLSPTGTIQYSNVFWDDGSMLQALEHERRKIGSSVFSECDMNKEIVLSSTLIVL